MANATQEAARLYVSAPSDLDLRPLLDGLKRRGTQPYVLSDVVPVGGDILESLRLAIRRADRILVVLSNPPQANPMLEAGFALALGKPVLIIAEPGATVPADLADQVIARARPDDLDAINFALDHIEQRAPVGTRRPHPQTGRPLRRARAKELLTRLSHSSAGEWPSINVLVEAIESSGGVAVVNEDRDAGFDLGVWSDDLEAIGGNPLLVELKQPLGPRRGEPGSPRPRCAPDGTTCVDRVLRAGGRGSATASGRGQRGPDSPF